MAAGDINSFLQYVRDQLDGATALVDWDTDTIKLAFVGVTATVTTIDSSQRFFGSFTAHEVSGGAVAAGGVTLAGKSVSVSGSYAIQMANAITLTATTTGMTGARWGLIYKDTGTPGTSPLLHRLDLGTTRANDSVDLIINFAGANKNKVQKVKW
jgi:hypothetical protein